MRIPFNLRIENVFIFNETETSTRGHLLIQVEKALYRFNPSMNMNVMHPFYYVSRLGFILPTEKSFFHPHSNKKIYGISWSTSICIWIKVLIFLFVNSIQGLQRIWIYLINFVYTWWIFILNMIIRTTVTYSLDCLRICL